MLASDDGRIWMVYTSVYGRVNNRSRLALWCTSSNDGHDWTEPEPIGSLYDHHLLTDFIRCPNGDYLVCCRAKIGRSDAPNRIGDLETLKLPIRTQDGIHEYPRLTFDSRGACHVVAPLGKEGDIGYSYSVDMIFWTPVEVVAKSNTKPVWIDPRILTLGHDAVLVYGNDGSTEIKRAVVTDDGLQFTMEPPTKSEAIWSDVPMFRDEDRFLSVVSYPDRFLRVLPFDELFP